MNDTIVTFTGTSEKDYPWFKIQGLNSSDFDSFKVVITGHYVSETVQKPIYIWQPQKYTEGKVCFLMTASFILGFLLCLVITWIRS